MVGDSVVPIKKHSSGSLVLDQVELRKDIHNHSDKARKVDLGSILNPFDSEYDTSSDPESDF